jgi:hypothetical protein
MCPRSSLPYPTSAALPCPRPHAIQCGHSSDSKFPSSTMSGGLVPYAWDPSDNQDDGDEEDSLHALKSVDKPISLLNPIVFRTSVSSFSSSAASSGSSLHYPSSLTYRTRPTPSLSMRLVATPSIPLRVLSMSVHLLVLVLPTQPRLVLV